MKYLMWDIDGTLLLTGGAGKNALIKVIKDYYFLDAFDFTESLAGRTDSDIVKKVVQRLRGSYNVAEVAGILIRYHMELPRQLPLYKGKVLKNVEKTLQYFHKDGSKYQNCLLTGNTRTGAQLKLEHYGIDKYFHFDHSAFGELSENRQELAKILWQRMYLANPQLTADDLIFIGDTPNDIACAKAIGARCLAILEGSFHTREELENAGPWRVIDALPDDPAELEKLFEEA